MIVVDILPESFNVLQITLAQAVKVWKTEYVMLHSNIQGGRASYSWGPFLGHVMVDITALSEKVMECVPRIWMDGNVAPDVTEQLLTFSPSQSAMILSSSLSIVS